MILQLQKVFSPAFKYVRRVVVHYMVITYYDYAYKVE